MLVVVALDARRHDRAGFTCGEPSLDDYLQRLAVQHRREGVSTTHVLVDDDSTASILGYYALSAAQLLLGDLREADRSRLPRHPVPAVRMGRLAVATAAQGNGYGDFLLADAVARCLTLRTQLGVRVLLVDSLHEKAAAFYRAYGFRPTSDSARTLYLPLGKP